MNLNIAITVDLRTSLFSNGINQNGLYLAMMYQDMGCHVTLLSAAVEDGGFKQLEEIGFNQIQIKKIFDSFDDRYDLVIGLGLLVEQSYIDKWKQQNPDLKYVSYKCGNELFTDMETIFHGAHEKRAEIFNNLPFPAIPDQIWSIPQMENTNLDYYSFTLHQENATVVPFIWDPIVVENYSKKNNHKEWSGFRTKSIGVMEPNLSIMKNVLPPIMILDRYLNMGYDYSSAYLFSLRKYSTNARLLKILKEAKNGLVKKVTAEDRIPTSLALDKYVDLVLSWQLENNLNYLYFDVAWMGYPIVHNANLCQDIGYYYPNQDAKRAAEMINTAFTTHTESYKEEQRWRIKRFTRQNPRLVAQYRKLTEDLMSGKFHKYIYNWKENEIYY